MPKLRWPVQVSSLFPYMILQFTNVYSKVQPLAVQGNIFGQLVFWHHFLSHPHPLTPPQLSPQSTLN